MAQETVRYYETGQADGGIAEVSDAEEARELARVYRSLIDKIHHKEQRKAPNRPHSPNC